MIAAVLRNLNTPLSIEEIYRTDEGCSLQSGQVIVKILCTGICGAQLQEIDGLKGSTAHLPHLLGHEGCGKVLSVGPNVRNVQKGDKVVLHWRKGVGIQCDSASYDDGIKSGPIATFSQIAVISENRLTKIPSDVPDDLAALFGCALSTALATIENVAKVRFGERVLVVGCGGVGLSMILAAKLAHALVIGIDHVDKSQWVTLLNAPFYSLLPAGPPFDVIIDTTGTLSYFRSLAPSGRYIIVGQPNKSLTILEPIHLFDGEGQTIQATQGGGFNPTLDIPRYVNLWRSGALDNYKNLISHRINLEAINHGIEWMRDGLAARVMITP